MVVQGPPLGDTPTCKGSGPNNNKISVWVAMPEIRLRPETSRSKGRHPLTTNPLPKKKPSFGHQKKCILITSRSQSPEMLPLLTEAIGRQAANITSSTRKAGFMASQFVLGDRSSLGTCWTWRLSPSRDGPKEVQLVFVNLPLEWSFP